MLYPKVSRGEMCLRLAYLISVIPDITNSSVPVAAYESRDVLFLSHGFSVFCAICSRQVKSMNCVLRFE